MRPRIDQHGLVVHNGVSIVRRTVFGRHLIVGEAVIRQDYANADRFTIKKRRMVLADHVLLEARTLIDAEHAGYTASDGPEAPPTTAPTGPAARSPSRAPCSIPPTTPWAMADAGKINATEIAAALINERAINFSSDHLRSSFSFH